MDFTCHSKHTSKDHYELLTGHTSRIRRLWKCDLQFYVGTGGLACPCCSDLVVTSLIKRSAASPYRPPLQHRTPWSIRFFKGREIRMLCEDGRTYANLTHHRTPADGFFLRTQAIVTATPVVFIPLCAHQTSPLTTTDCTYGWSWGC